MYACTNTQLVLYTPWHDTARMLARIPNFYTHLSTLRYVCTNTQIQYPLRHITACMLAQIPNFYTHLGTVRHVCLHEYPTCIHT